MVPTSPKRFTLSLCLPQIGKDVITVAIQRDGNAWLGNQRCSSPEQLQAGIKEAVANGSERKVYLRTDMRSRYGVLREVLPR